MRVASLALALAVVTAVLALAALTRTPSLVASGAMAKEFFTRRNAKAAYTSLAPAASGGAPAHERARLVTDCLWEAADGLGVVVPRLAGYLGNKDLLTDGACRERQFRFGDAMSKGGTVTCTPPRYKEVSHVSGFNLHGAVAALAGMPGWNAEWEAALRQQYAAAVKVGKEARIRATKDARGSDAAGAAKNAARPQAEKDASIARGKVLERVTKDLRGSDAAGAEKRKLNLEGAFEGYMDEPLFCKWAGLVNADFETRFGGVGVELFTQVRAELSSATALARNPVGVAGELAADSFLAINPLPEFAGGVPYPVEREARFAAVLASVGRAVSKTKVAATETLIIFTRGAPLRIAPLLMEGDRGAAYTRFRLPGRGRGTRGEKQPCSGGVRGRLARAFAAAMRKSPGAEEARAFAVANIEARGYRAF